MKRVSKKDITTHIEQIEAAANHLSSMAVTIDPQPVLTGSELAHALCKAGILNFRARVSDASDALAMNNRTQIINRYNSERSDYFFNNMTYAVPITDTGEKISSTVAAFSATYL